MIKFNKMAPNFHEMGGIVQKIASRFRDDISNGVMSHTRETAHSVLENHITPLVCPLRTVAIRLLDLVHATTRARQRGPVVGIHADDLAEDGHEEEDGGEEGQQDDLALLGVPPVDEIVDLLHVVDGVAHRGDGQAQRV